MCGCVPCRHLLLETLHTNAGMSSKGLTKMWTTDNFTARTLLWVAVLMLPSQGIHAASCGCGNSASAGLQHGRYALAKVRKSGNCCVRKRAESFKGCCSGPQQVSARQGRVSRTSCCQTESVCNCGASCQCGKAKQPTPSTPPAQKITSDKLGSELAAAATAGTFHRMQPIHLHTDVSFTPGDILVMDCCISLCRFTL